MKLKIYPNGQIAKVATYLVYVAVTIELFYFLRSKLASFLNIYLKNEMNSDGLAVWALMGGVAVFWIIITLFFAVDTMMVSSKKPPQLGNREFVAMRIIMGIPFLGLLILGTSVSKYSSSTELYKNSLLALILILVGLFLLTMQMSYLSKVNENL